MRTCLLLFLFPCFSFVAKAGNNPTNFVVWAKNGTKVVYALKERPKIVFTESDLIITTKGVEVNYSLNNMDRFTYESKDYSSVRDIKTNEQLFKLDGDRLLFPALRANSSVSIYSLNGILVFKKTIQIAGEYSFPLSNLEAGIYVVTVNGLTYRIVKR